MDLEIPIRNEKNNVFISDVTVQNDRLNDEGKNVNSLSVTRKKYVLSTTRTVRYVKKQWTAFKQTWNHVTC